VKIRVLDILLISGLLLSASVLRAQTTAAGFEPLLVGAGKTQLLDMPVNVERVSVASPEIAEAVPVSARSLMINGRGAGETSLVIWLSDGTRRAYDLQVRPNSARLDAAVEQITREFGGSVQLTSDPAGVYLTGHVRDLYDAERANMIAGTLGRVVNLLKVDVPPQEKQILLKVRFADVDRSKAMDLGANFFGTPQGIPFTATTGTYSPTRIGSVGQGTTNFSLSDALNLFLFDPHLNAGATIKALANQNVLQILAEPNVLAMNGREASFVSGGEFPFPNLQGGGGGVGQVTVSFKEFGIRIRFLPTITPRGTIRLHVAPEVSSLDFANSLSISGATVPALDTRRVETEVELQNGQSFAIAGLLDNRTTESLSKIPGLANIPLFGKLFQTRSTSKSNSELLVIITPELVEPMQAGEAPPDIPRPQSFLEGAGILTQAPRTPGVDQTGPGPARPVRTEIPVQELEDLQKGGQTPLGGSSTGSSAQPLPGNTPTPSGASPGFNPAITQPLPPSGASPTGGGAGAK
jgi:pilus assembly protein CpaC